MTNPFADQIRVNRRITPHASRAVGILRGRLLPDLERMPRGFILEITEESGIVNRIPGVMLNQARDQVTADPSLIGSLVDVLCYPRTVKKDLTIQAVQILPAKGRFNPDQDFFWITGVRMKTRAEGMVKIGIRANRTKKQISHNFEKFWLELYGHLENDGEGIFLIKAVRRGVRLFIVESSPRPTGNTSSNGTASPKPRDRSSEKRASEKSPACRS